MTLEEVWEQARKVVGDDIAQQAAVEALGRSDKSVPEAAWFRTRARYLRLQGYTDGVDIKMIRGVRGAGYQLETGGGWSSVLSHTSPEDMLLAKERAYQIEKTLEQTKGEKYEPVSDPSRCRKGHEGGVYFKLRPQGLVKLCRQCRAIADKKYGHRNRHHAE